MVVDPAAAGPSDGSWSDGEARPVGEWSPTNGLGILRLVG